LVTVTILILSLFTINMLLVVQVISKSTIDAIKEKVDISIFLKIDADEDQIAELQTRIESLSSVKELKYVSKAEALELFREKHQNNPEILKALREIGKNPLTPSFVVKPAEISSSEKFIHDLNTIQSDLIESKNFSDHRLLLNKINSITDKVNRVGIFMSAVFIIITLIVVYNSIRVAVYTHRKEIAIMKLVGASSSFVYMPFLLSSIIYTFLGLSITIMLFYPFLSLLQPYLEAFFVGYNINLIQYFNANFLYIFGLQFAGMALINIVASLIAVRKYTKV
jgi:cell division transport system permease protein